MPWRETGPMEERLGLVVDVLEGRFTVTEACPRRNVGRKSAYKYLAQFQAEGPSGLEARSRRPHASPIATSEKVRELLIATKKARGHWGPKKLVVYLTKRHPRLVFPAPSTVGAILKEAWAGRAPAAASSTLGACRLGARTCGGRRPESGLVHRFQGRVPPGQWAALLTAHPYRSLQP